jgi:hypothetical protein
MAAAATAGEALAVDRARCGARLPKALRTDSGDDDRGNRVVNDVQLAHCRIFAV